MRQTAEKAALDQWYCIEALKDITTGRAANRLLGSHSRAKRFSLSRKRCRLDAAAPGNAVLQDPAIVAV